MSDWSLYVIRCCDDSLYTGIARDVHSRFAQHLSGCGAKYTRGRAPLVLEYSRAVGDRSRALKLEYRVKRLKRRDKERLLTGSLALDSLVDP